MHTYTVTITSKNQITLPAHLVRKFKLQKGQRLQVEGEGSSIKLKKQPSLEELMAPFHAELAAKMKGKRVPTDEELKIAVRQIAAERALR